MFLLQPQLVLGGGAPQYDRESKEPAYFAETFKFNIDEVEEPDFEECKKIAHPLFLFILILLQKDGFINNTIPW